MPLANSTKPKYQLQLHQVNRYDWTALVVDLTGEAPNATTIHGRSLPELLAKCLIAVTLHDKNAGVDVPDDGIAPGVATEDSAPPAPPIILTPNRKIVEPPTA
jgi:hypothetical protein